MITNADKDITKDDIKNQQIKISSLEDTLNSLKRAYDDLVKINLTDIGGILSLKDIFKFLIDFIPKFIDFHAITLLLYERETENFKPVRSINFEPLFNNSFFVRMKEIYKWVIDNGQIVFLPSEKSNLNDFLIPLRVLNKGIGLIHMLTPMATEDITQQQKNFLRVIANQVAISIENINLIENERRTRERLIQSEKMIALGSIISGIAHELNNPLTTILGYSELILKDMKITNKSLREKLEIIFTEADRASKIVHDLLLFVRKHESKKEYININEVIDKTVFLSSYNLKVNNIIIELNLEPTLPKTMANFYQLQQVFFNIINNAEQELISSHKPRKIIISSFFKKMDNLIHIEFFNNGPLIDEENLKNIFNPFFTTKEVGKGTGLGLSISYNIVKEHNGDIWAYNKEDGVCFIIELPVIIPSKEKSEKIIQDETSYIQGKNILVVDDEPYIRKFLLDVLSAENYNITIAIDGEDALEKVRNKDFDLIIVDLRMPNLSGREFYEIVKEFDINLSKKIIFSTGDVISEDILEFLNGTGNFYIKKPFKARDIREIVKKTLSSIN